MKAFFFTLKCILLPIVLFSQSKDDKIIYLDSSWNETTIEDFKYLRLVKDYNLHKNEYKVIDYYESGKVKMEGSTDDKDKFSKTGQLVYYYENGNRESITFFKKNKPVGKYYELYDNGNKRIEGEFFEEKKKNPNIYKIQSFWDENNNQKVIDGNGIYEKKENDFYTIGKIKNGLKDSIWSGWFDKQKINFQEEYKDGKFISGISRDENNASKPYVELEKNAVPVKGLNHFYKYVADKIDLGWIAKRRIGYKRVELTDEELEKIKTNSNQHLSRPASLPFEGKTFVSFTVEKDGKINNIRIIKSIDKTLDLAIIKILLNYDDWIPSEQRGIKVGSKFSLPITIQSSR